MGVSGEKMQNYIDKSIFAAQFNNSEGVYLNTIQRLLICDGIIGLIFFCFFLLSFMRGCNIAGKCIITVYISMMFVESMYFSPSMQLYIVSAYCMLKKGVGLERVKISL